MIGVVVRWPGKTRGALVFALNFWFFWFKPKEHKKHPATPRLTPIVKLKLSNPYTTNNDQSPMLFNSPLTLSYEDSPPHPF